MNNTNSREALSVAVFARDTETAAWLCSILEARGHKSSILSNVRTSEVESALTTTDVLVIAGDTTPEAVHPVPALPYIRRRNVEPLTWLLPGARAGGVRRVVVVGSYLTALDRLRPDLEIAMWNPLPAALQEQGRLLVSLCEGHMDLVILEAAPVIGNRFRNTAFWTLAVSDLTSGGAVVETPGGGTALITENQLASAILSACERGTGSRRLPIAGFNLLYHEIYGLMAQVLGMRIRLLSGPREASVWRAEEALLTLGENGFEAGCSPVVMDRWRSEVMFIDPAPGKEELGFDWEDPAAAFLEMLGNWKP